MAFLFGAAPDASPQTPTEKPKLICRETQQQTGSHIRTGRRCKTAEQWLKYDADLDGIPPTMRMSAMGRKQTLRRQPTRSGQSTIPKPTILMTKTMVRITGTPAA